MMSMFFNRALGSADAFRAHVAELQGKPCFRRPLGWGIFRIKRSAEGRQDVVLSGSYPCLNWTGENLGSFALYAEAAGLFRTESQALWHEPELVVEMTSRMVQHLMRGFAPFLDEAHGDAHRNVQVADLMNLGNADDHKLVVLFDDVPCRSLEAAYMKLTAISKRLVTPLALNVQGIFSLLPNVAWAGNKAYELSWLRANELRLKMEDAYPAIDYVDKFPRWLMQMVPDEDIRILATHTVRFGAHVARGTTVMPGAAYINFNAGTLGTAMVEGRISSSAAIGEGTDVGGGASILGTLSGGNKEPIAIGRNCLLGANSVTGISLGDGCVVDAGVTVLAGARVTVHELEQKRLREVNPELELRATWIYKAAELARLHGVHFRQDSESGTLMALRSARQIELNAALHA